jgi:hypothetical protein
VASGGDYDGGGDSDFDDDGDGCNSSDVRDDIDGNIDTAARTPLPDRQSIFDVRSDPNLSNTMKIQILGVTGGRWRN